MKNLGKDMKIKTPVEMMNVVARKTRLARALVLLGVGAGSGNPFPWAVREPLC